MRITVPVNIRKVFKLELDDELHLVRRHRDRPRLGRYSFSEILQQVKFQLRSEVNAETLSRQISRNDVVGGMCSSGTPRLFKLPLMKNFSYSYGDGIYTTCLEPRGPSHTVGDERSGGRGDSTCPPEKSQVAFAVVGTMATYGEYHHILSEQTLIEREIPDAMSKMGILSRFRPTDIQKN